MWRGASPEELARWRAEAEAGRVNPRDLKAQLARRLVAEFHSEEAARRAEEEFNRVFRERGLPSEIPVVHLLASVGDHVELARVLVHSGLAPSMREARRLIEQGGVQVEGERITDPRARILVKPEFVLQVGKRRFVRVRSRETPSPTST